MSKRRKSTEDWLILTRGASDCPFFHQIRDLSTDLLGGEIPTKLLANADRMSRPFLVHFDQVIDPVLILTPNHSTVDLMGSLMEIG